MRTRKSFPLRIDPLLYESIERWAAHDLRSVNAQIEFLLWQAVRGRNKKQPPLPSSSSSPVVEEPRIDESAGSDTKPPGE